MKKLNYKLFLIMIPILILEVLILQITPFKNFNLFVQRILIVIISIITWEVVKYIYDKSKFE
jgi:hypothetical protein